MIDAAAAGAAGVAAADVESLAVVGSASSVRWRHVVGRGGVMGGTAREGCWSRWVDAWVTEVVGGGLYGVWRAGRMNGRLC